jgi:hypothetical protein
MRLDVLYRRFINNLEVRRLERTRLVRGRLEQVRVERTRLKERLVMAIKYIYIRVIIYMFSLK